MAVVNPPSYLQYGAHSAASDRLTAASLLQPGALPMSTLGGVRPSGNNASLKVLPQATPNNSVIVSPGTVYVPEADGQGAYVCHNDANVTVNITAASTTQNRRDLIVAQVNDQEVSGSLNTWTLVALPGTLTSGTAVAPAVPSNAFALAEINVPAGGSTVIASASITDRRATAASIGGLLPTTSAALPTNPYQGMAVYCSDDDTVRVWSAAASVWRTQSFYPLPSVAAAYDLSNLTITATTIAAASPSLDFVTPRPVLTMLTLSAMCSTSSGTMYIAIGLTGATTGTGTSNTADPNLNKGDWAGTTSNLGETKTVNVPYVLNAGTTHVTAMAQRSGTATAIMGGSFGASTLRVVPLRYV